MSEKKVTAAFVQPLVERDVTITMPESMAKDLFTIVAHTDSHAMSKGCNARVPAINCGQLCDKLYTALNKLFNYS